MSTDALAGAEPAETGEQPRLLAVEIGDWPGLGNDVLLELGGRRTVLVGRNGAGKSLLVQGLHEAAFVPFMGPARRPPRHFRCDVALPGSAPVTYEYRVGSDEVPEELDVPSVEMPPRVPSWSERCQTMDDGSEVWRVEGSKLTVADGTISPFLPGMGLLAIVGVMKVPVAVREIADSIRRLLRGFAMVPAGVPREDARRVEILVPRIGPSPSGSRRWGSVPGRVGMLAQAITSMYESQRERYDEFVALLCNLGVVREVSVEIYEDPREEPSADQRRDFASVLFDGLNIGFQSDGTLRVAEIVRLLLRANATCLLIEEPETAVHPGLLSKLLALMDSYGYDRQIIVSTHSPQVVDWCEPEQLRLVERIDGNTQVRSLDPADLGRVKRYLQDEGTFSDFVFGRSEG